MKRLSLLFIVCILGLSLLGGVNCLQTVSDSHNPNNTDLSIQEVELLEDPHLAEPQTIVDEGLSSSFIANYEPPSSGKNDSRLYLTWNHTIGAPLDFKSDDELDSNLPECNDFIYFEQEFEWTLNRIPQRVDVGVTTGITTTGNFSLTSEFYKWYVWLIDSSDNFIEIHESHQSHHSYLLYESYRLDYSELVGAWGGMIEDTNGFQEDPTDILRFAIGLAPTLAFMNYTNMYEGTVQLTISDVSLIWYSDSLYNYLMEPTYSYRESVSTPYRSIYDIEIAPSGAVYAVAVPDYQYLEYSSIIMKLDSELNLIWKKTIPTRYGSSAVALEFAQGRIYSVGIAIDPNGLDKMILNAWDSAGDLIINKTYQFNFQCTPYDIVYSPDGALYITGTWYNWTLSEPSGFILKCDLSGKLLWYQLAGYYDRGYEMVAAKNGTVYVRSLYSTISAWSPEGYKLWNGTYLLGNSIAIDRNDDLYITLDYFGGEVVYKLDSNGTQIWNSTWGSNDRYEFSFHAYPRGIVTAASGQSYVVVTNGYYDPFIVKREVNGSISNIWRWNIYGWSFTRHPIEIGNGMIYVCGRGYDEVVHQAVGIIIAFADVDLKTSFIDATTASLLIVSFSTVGICATVIFGIEKKWFEKFHSRLGKINLHRADRMEKEGK